MPISSMHFPTISGGISMLTPSASNTSALPELLETDLFPCLATGTPVPATTNAAVVEMLKVWETSPPVPLYRQRDCVRSQFLWIFRA